jgi:hypothetical protein
MTSTKTDLLSTAALPATLEPLGASGEKARRQRRGGILATSLAMGTYAALAVLANMNAWTLGATRALQQPYQDPKLNAWYVAWTPFALVHGVNPLFSHWVNVPFGANFAANVAMPLLALIASPVTAIWGPVAGVNFLISLGFFACCVAGYCFVRHWTTWRPAAFFGGLLYGFSPYVVADGRAHIHTMFVALVPFIFILLDEILVRQRYSPRILGSLLGLVVIAQYFISSEVLATTAIMSFVTAIFVSLFNLGKVRLHLIRALPALGIALGLALLFLAYPVIYSQRGSMHYTLIVPRGQYQADLLSAILPTSNQLVAPTAATAISDHFANNLSENGSYLGLPLVSLLVVATIVCRRSKVVVVALLAAFTAYVLSLGSPLLVGNHYIGWLRLPGAVFHQLPLLQGAVMARFAVFVVLFAALVLGVAIDRLRAWPGWSDRWIGPVAAVGTGIAVMLPLVPNLPYTVATVDTPSFFTSSAVDSVPANSVAVVYPPTTAATSPPSPDSTLWQASADMRFKMPGAYALVPGAGGQAKWGTPTLTTRTLAAIAGGERVPEQASLRHALRRQWRSWDVQTFIMGPGGNEKAARQFVSWVLGRAPERRQGVYVWYGLQRSLSRS